MIIAYFYGMKWIKALFSVIFSISSVQAQDAWNAKNDSLLQVISQSSDDSVKAYAYSGLKEVWQTKNFRKAVAYGHQALYHAKKGGGKSQTIDIMFQLAFAYMSIGNAAASIDILQQIIPLTKNEDLDGHGTALSFIAMNYLILKDYDNSLKYMREAFDLELVMNNKGQYLGQVSYLGSRLNMANVFVGKNQIDSALHYGKIAYQRLKSEKLKPESIHFAWNIPLIYGDALRIAKHNAIAMQLYNEALHCAQQQNYQAGINSVKFSMAQLFEQMQQPDSALKYAHEALEGFEQSANYPQLSEAGLLIYSLYKKSNATKALQYYEIGMAARDSVINREKILQVQYLEDKQERQKRELEIERQQVQNRQWLYMSLAALISLVIITLILYRNNRQKQYLNKQLVHQKSEIEELNESLEQKVELRTAELQKALNEVQTAFDRGQFTERKRVSTDLHDEIGSALSTIAIFSDVTKRKAQKTAPELVSELENIGKKSREMVQTMRDTIWTLNDDTTQNPWERMQQYSIEVLTVKGIVLNWQLSNDLPNNLSFSVKRNLFLAYKEAIHNILKHAEATKVRVECQKQHGNLWVTITDNGKGFDLEVTRNKGNGLQNFQKRMAEISGAIQIESKIGAGSKLTFVIPLTNP